jgi:hypothetical protein
MDQLGCDALKSVLIRDIGQRPKLRTAVPSLRSPDKGLEIFYRRLTVKLDLNIAKADRKHRFLAFL